MASEKSRGVVFNSNINPIHQNKTSSLKPAPTLREFSLAVQDTNPITFEDIFSSLVAANRHYHNGSDKTVVHNMLGLNLSSMDLGEVFKENNRNSMTTFRIMIQYIDLYVVPLVSSKDASSILDEKALSQHCLPEPTVTVAKRETISFDKSRFPGTRVMLYTLSEEVAHSTVHQHLRLQSSCI